VTARGSIDARGFSPRIRHLRLLTVLGARPQFVKAAPLSRALHGHHEEVLVHTGQHDDHLMSAVFFGELGIASPAHHLGVGSGTHAAQTAAMLVRLEALMIADRPDAVLVYGDSNSTLAGALTAAKLQIPVAHVEAGLRSFNRSLPEEHNRIITDHLSNWLFVPSAIGERHLRTEGVAAGVFIVGDIMLDATLQHVGRAEQVSRYPGAAGVGPGDYYLCTVHRAENTDKTERLRAIFEALAAVSQERKVVVPLHPRTRSRLEADELVGGSLRSLCLIEPVGYLDMMLLEKHAELIVTDSGGVQKEAYFHRVPCVTLRTETEWVELVEAGWNMLVAPNTAKHMISALHLALERRAALTWQCLYGDGHAADRIANRLLSGDC